MLTNLKIGQRLALGFGLLLALLASLAGMSAIQMANLADSANYYTINLIPSYETEHDISLALANIRRFDTRHILLNTSAEKDAADAKIEALSNTALAGFDRYAKDLVSDDEDKRDMTEAHAAFDAYMAESHKLRAASRLSASDPSKAAQAMQLLVGESANAYEGLQSGIQKWWDYNIKLAKAQDAASQAAYGKAKITLVSLVAAALALGVAAAVVITRSITKPIQQAVDIASTVARGDLSSHIDVQGHDETAQLLRALTQMNDNLARIVGQVRSSSDNIATGSAQIASGNADLSQRTEEQASNLQQTAASMEQLSSTVKTNADTANHANELAASASVAAVKGGEVVNSVVLTMQDIAASSKKIADIIGVIDGIAFQTNILALNAAVEAARAGEQGRGFAVVASEVRSLASRSADAAKEIKTLIGASVEKVEAGAKQVDDAGASMSEIVSQVKRVSDLIGEISSATVEQSSGIGQVGNAIMQLDQVTQQNAALVEQSAAAAESLRHQAASLAEAVSVFKLAGGRQGVATFGAGVAHVSRSEARASSIAAKAPAFKAAHVAGGGAFSKQAQRSHQPSAAADGHKSNNDDWDTF